MRDFKGMKRQRGRNRNGGGTGGGKPQQNVNRAFDSNGPDNVKIRGHAQHVFEKYQQLARDSFSSGDRVLAENYLQHADHYFRVLRMLQPQRPAAEILGRDVFTSGLDIDFEDDGEGFEESGEAAADPQEATSNGFNGSDARDTRSDRDRADRDRADRDRAERDRAERDRPDRFDSRPERRDDRFEGRSDPVRTQSFEPRREGEGNRDGRRDNRRFEGRPERAPRDGQSRDGQPRDSQPRDSQSRDYQGRDNPTRSEGQSPRSEYRDERPARTEERAGDDRRYGARNEAERANSEVAPRDLERRDLERRDMERRDPLALIEPDSAPLMPTAFVEAEASPMLRSQDGGVSEAPAFLQAAANLDDGGEVRRPRTRRRRPKALEEGGDEDAAPAPAVEEA